MVNLNPVNIEQQAHLAAQVLSMIEEANSSEDEALVHDMLEGETNIVKMIEAVLSSMKDAVWMTEALKQREKELQERRKRFEARSEAGRALLQQIMEKTGLQKLVLPEATLSIGAKPASVVVYDEAAIPDDFWKVERKLDKKALLAALKESPGVAGAQLSNGGASLTIRNK